LSSTAAATFINGGDSSSHTEYYYYYCYYYYYYYSLTHPPAAAMVLTVPINPLLDQVVHRLIESTERVVDGSGVEWSGGLSPQNSCNSMGKNGWVQKDNIYLFIDIYPHHIHSL